MKELFTPKKFNPSSMEVIEQANEIIVEYSDDGYDLTLRQLYYQFVARDLIPNTQKSYKRMGSIINDARLAGMVDWSCIKDRTRSLKGGGWWNSISDLIDSYVDWYDTDLWKTQPSRIEVWIEKEALIGVIEDTCSEHHVRYFACRGYVSASFMYEAGKRFARYARGGQDTIVLHLGDHDPSGIDMTRDIEDRLRLFMGIKRRFLTMKRIALNMDQVDQYSPPPNPAKLTDSRANDYVNEYGYDSWELDALQPSVINDLIEEEIIQYKDDGLYELEVEKRDEGREKLRQIARDLENE